MSAFSDPVPPSQVREQLDRICASEEFRRCHRSRRFLGYIVEETLEGREARIKAYCVAISVLDRDETFDPQSDPLVRIEAAQLRRRLERYYLTRGSGDPVLIDLPKGGYIPVFSRRTPVVPEGVTMPKRPPGGLAGASMLAALSVAGVLGVAYAIHDPDMVAAALGGPMIPAVRVLPFSPAEDSRSAEMASGIADEITQELTRRRVLAVLGAEGSSVGTSHRADAILTGTVRTGSGMVRVTASLVSARNGTYIWTKAYDRPVEEPALEAQARVAAEIGADLELPMNGQQDRAPAQTVNPVKHMNW
ncbi:hypothetical protein JL100_016725 [Skermanella mucosa]|uniref:hypothetical protein n=1 Tax=Skermanella mucosa TaxID=1789672 RepID=UPI00192BA554|nr:hypothetical protein [Skermanella mucosa]UEM18740.1 hypothetical protein JL100_016725 [Skermanella mucosa]